MHLHLIVREMKINTVVKYLMLITKWLIRQQIVIQYIVQNYNHKFIKYYCHNGFPSQLGRLKTNGVVTDLFCTGVIGHPGHMFLN